MAFTTKPARCAMLMAALCAGCSSGGQDGATAALDAGPPSAASEFADGAGFTAIPHAGTVSFGVAEADADDHAVAALTFPGDATKASGFHTGPAWASEMDSDRADFRYGEYRARLQLAACDSAEELVNGFFTYFNDGADHNGNGLIDNSEIDIEIQCGRPYAIFLTSWTDYTDDAGNFRKWTRVIDTATGDIWESVAADQYDLEKTGNSAAFRIPGFPQANAYYEMGFDWEPDQIRWFLVNEGREITLFNFRNAALIPSLPASLIFNLWHAGDHWFGDDSAAADYPANDATLRVDWVKYWRD